MSRINYDYEFAVAYFKEHVKGEVYLWKDYNHRMLSYCFGLALEQLGMTWENSKEERENIIKIFKSLEIKYPDVTTRSLLSIALIDYAKGKSMNWRVEVLFSLGRVNELWWIINAKKKYPDFCID